MIRTHEAGTLRAAHAGEQVVLSGHGPQTTIGAERAGNPYLAGLTPSAGPSRGL